MDSRRLLLLVLLALHALPARASEHNIQCGFALSDGKFGSLALRNSCGVRVQSTPIVDVAPIAPIPVPPPPPPSPIQGSTPGFQASPATTAPAHADEEYQPKYKRALFLIWDLSTYVQEGNTGHSLDSWGLGAQYFVAQALSAHVQPFVRAWVGGERRAREQETLAAGDQGVGLTTVVVAGGGLDAPLRRSGSVVPVLSVQGDVVFPSGGEDSGAYGRVAAGLSFRFEGSHHHK